MPSRQNDQSESQVPSRPRPARRVPAAAASFERSGKPPSSKRGLGRDAPAEAVREDAPEPLAVWAGGITGISFLSEPDGCGSEAEPEEWQRYVDDRLRHFTISHR